MVNDNREILEVGNNARVKIIIEPPATKLQIHLGKNTDVELYSLYRGGVVGVTQQVYLDEGARCRYHMLLIDTSDTEHKISLDLVHTAPRAWSRFVARRIITGCARSTLYGNLRIGEQASKCDTYLSDKVLLIGGKARAVSIPALEILTDDVRASHGAAVGHLDANELFYLQTRGLTPQSATNLLTTAFAHECWADAPLEFQKTCNKALRDLQLNYA